MTRERVSQVEKIVPNGLFSLDDEQGCILVIATAKEQEMLAKAVTELETAAVAEEDRKVVSYKMSSTVAQRFSSLLRQLSGSKKEHKELYGITELRDIKQGYVTVWATEKQHEIIRALLDEMLGHKSPTQSAAPGTAAPEVPVLMVYPMFRGYAYTAHNVLGSLLPDAEYSYDPRTNAVIAVATPEMQTLIEKAVLELDKSVNEDIAFFTLVKDMPPSTMGQLFRLAPHTSLVQGRRNLQVIAIGPKEEIAKIKAVLASLAESQDKEEMMIHTLLFASPFTATSVLEQVFPEIKMTVNQAANQLVIQLPKELKIPVTELLNQLDGDLEFVPVKKNPSPQLLQSLRTLAPRATIIVDADNSQVMIQGAKPDVERIKKVLLQAEESKPLEEEVYIHSFKQAHPYYVASLMQTVYPEVKVAGYPVNATQLAVRIPPGMKEKVLKLFEEFDGDITFIPLKREVTPEMLTNFQRIAPYTVVMQDRKRSQLIVYGQKPDIEKIQKLVTASEADEKDVDEVYVHTFRQGQPFYALSVLQGMYPEIALAAHPTTNQLALRLHPELKEKIVKLLEELDGDIVFVPLKKELTPELLNSFSRLAPYATVVEDKQNALAMIYGSKPDIEKIQKIITTTETALPPAEEVIVHHLKYVDSPMVVSVLKEIYPDAKIKDDPENARLVIRVMPTRKEAVLALLKQLDAQDEEAEKRFFKAYPIDSGFYSINPVPGRGHYSSATFVTELQKLVPRAKLTFDDSTQQLIVWGTAKEHEAVEAAVKNMNGDGSEKKYGRFQLRRLDAYNAMSIIRRLYPTVNPTYDMYGTSVVVEGHPRLIKKIGEMIESIDPSEPGENDPCVRFYSFAYEPTPELVQGIARLAPGAYVVPDKEAKQVMVIAKPLQQKIIAESVNAIQTTFTAPEEPMLFIYPATTEQRERLEAFIQTAARDLKGVAIVKDKAQNQVSVWAKPSEHKLIAEILKQMTENKMNEPAQKLKVFYMSLGDLTTAQEILKLSYPNAVPFADKQGNRLLVLATEDELKKITETLAVQGSIDDRHMVAYPVAGAKPETLLKVIQDVYSGVKVTPEPQTKRILVWGTPEEHTKIADIVEQSNKKEDPNSELSEKFAAYSMANLDPQYINRLFSRLIPDSEVYADPTADKIIVRARVRDHAQIQELLEQLREKDELLKPVLTVYPIGEADPVMLETILRSSLPNAESMSPDNVLRAMGETYYYERMYQAWHRMNYGSTKKKTGYYKVDPKTKSVYVFVSAGDQKEAANGIEQIIKTGNIEGHRLIVKRYSLEEMTFFNAWQLLQEIVPAAQFHQIYSPLPAFEGRRGGFMMSYRDFLAHANENDHKKIEALVNELNDRSGDSRKEMLGAVIPDGSHYGRERLIELVQRVFPDSFPMPGGAPNQILVWASPHKLIQIQKIIDEACKPLAENLKTVVKSYPLQYISINEAKSWLAGIFPNAQFDPDAQQRFQRPPTAAKLLIVMATPIEHIEIEKAIKEIDKDIPDALKQVPRLYSLDDQPPAAIPSLRMSLLQAFPNAVCTQGAELQSLMVVATEEEHVKIADFIKSYKEDREHKRATLEVYVLKRQNYYRISTLITRVAPQALIFPGSKPDQISVWGTPREQADVSAALMKLETAANVSENQILKIYKVGNNKASTAYNLISYQFPGSVIFPINSNEIIAWTSPVDHETISKMLGTIAEAFPEPVLKTYYLKHVPLTEGVMFLNRVYAASGEAVITLRPSTGDLLVHATREIHDKIAKNIAEFDVPRPKDTEMLPVAYDLSELPPLQISATATLVRQSLGTEAIVFPSSVPGQLVVWAKTSAQEKIKTLFDQMLTERVETASEMEVYTITRGTGRLAQNTILTIVPNVKFGYGVNPNQLLVWAKPADQVKVKSVIDKINERDKDIVIESYSLKNTNERSVIAMVRTVIENQGLNVDATYETYGNQLIVEGKPEEQKIIKDLIEKMRIEEKEMAVFTLENNDPMTIYYAINTMFYDEGYLAPTVTPDNTSNMIFIQGSKEQIEKIRKLLIQMGETNVGTGELTPSAANITTPAPLQKSSNSQLRVIHLGGNANQTVKELEKRWYNYVPNRLLINRQDEPLIQKKEDQPEEKKEEPKEQPQKQTTEQGVSTSRFGYPALFSVNDPAEKPEGRGAENAADNAETLNPLPNVYVMMNEDGSITVASYDTAALDKLEQIIQRINSRVVFEGRDFTIYSVRNIAADTVALKIQTILRERLAGQPRYNTMGFAASSRYAPPRLEIIPDIINNTINVRGAKAERNEVANLIAFFDVSALPGELSITKPIKVPIKNTQASRVQQQVLNVYQQKMMSTRLPGGLYSRVAIDAITNSLEIIAPEPLASELKEYAEDIDRRTVEEPARKIHVIPLEVKSVVVQNALQVIRQSSMTGYPMGGYQMMGYPQMYPMMNPGMQYNQMMRR